MWRSVHWLTALITATTVPALAQDAFRSDVPKVWDDEALRSLEIPLAAKIPVRHVGSDFYYEIPVRPNVKTYPNYRRWQGTERTLGLVTNTGTSTCLRSGGAPH